MSPRKFIKTILLTFLGLLLALGAFNLFVNPYGEFSWSFFPPGTPPVRKYKEKVIKNAKRPVGYVVLGSSRLESLDPETVFPGENGINLITFNPYMEDIYAIWKHLLAVQGPPKGALIGLQVAFFKPTILEDAVLYGDKVLSPYLHWTLEERAGYEFMRFRRMFRLYAAWNSVAVMRKAFEGKGYLIKFDERGIAYIPGFPPRAKPLLRPSEEEVARRYQAIQARLIHIREIQYRNFPKLDEKKIAMLEEILSDMEKYKVKAYVITTPITPEMLEVSRRLTPFEEWRALMKSMCARHNIFFADFTDARKLDWLPLWEFVDCDHLSGDAIKVFELKLRDRLKASNGG